MHGWGMARLIRPPLVPRHDTPQLSCGLRPQEPMMVPTHGISTTSPRERCHLRLSRGTTPPSTPRSASTCRRHTRLLSSPVRLSTRRSRRLDCPTSVMTSVGHPPRVRLHGASTDVSCIQVVNCILVVHSLTYVLSKESVVCFAHDLGLQRDNSGLCWCYPTLLSSLAVNAPVIPRGLDYVDLNGGNHSCHRRALASSPLVSECLEVGRVQFGR